MSGTETTRDVISDRLSIAQHRKGFRFGLDALLLATDLPEVTDGATVYELGAGQGAVSLSISARRPGLRVVACERQDGLFGLLESNIAENARILGRVDAVKIDLQRFREELEPHSAALVVCNPPYYPLGKRNPSSNEERAAAHHELYGGLDMFVSAAAYVLEHRGWFKVIIPPWRLQDLVTAVTRVDLKVLSMRFFHADPTQDAYLVEVVCRRGGGPDLAVRAPLFVRGEDGFYTDEVARRVAGAALADPGEDWIARVRERSLASRRS